MKKTYQAPCIETTAIEPILMKNASIIDVKGMSSGEQIFGYGGGGNGPARSGESNLWDDEEDGSGWDDL